MNKTKEGEAYLTNVEENKDKEEEEVNVEQKEEEILN